GRSSAIFFFQAEDGIRDFHVTGVQTCALPISGEGAAAVYAGTFHWRISPVVCRTGGGGSMAGIGFELKRLYRKEGVLAQLRAHRSEEHTSELQSRENLVCRLLLEKKKRDKNRD